MLLGYARVSTDEQNPAHQLDALARAGVAADDVYLDRASGAKAAVHSSTCSCATCAPATPSS